MSRTAILRKQHDAIALLAGEIDAASKADEDSIEAGRIVRLLTRFDGILTAHLMSEDTFLYPAMKASSDTRAAQTAIRFSREMGGLVEDYGAFARAWRNESAILLHPRKFRTEWARLLGALSARIEREDMLLYPMADALDEPGNRTAA